MLFNDALDLFIRFHLSRLASGKYVKTRVLDKFMPFLDRNLEEITPTDVYAWFTAIGAQHPQAANKALSYLRTLFAFLSGLGVFRGISPCLGIKRYPGYPRKRFIQAGCEMSHLLCSLTSEPMMISTYMMVLLTTGCRPAEARRMQWAHLHLESGRWEIPVTKSRRPHVLMLPEELIARLQLLYEKMARGLPEGAAGETPIVRWTDGLVTPGHETTSDGGHKTRRRATPTLATFVFTACHDRPWSQSAVQNYWHRIRTRAGLPDVQLRDLRRTVASWMEEAGVSITDIGQVLNHSSQKTTIWYLAGLRPDRAIKQNLSQHLDRILAHGGKADGEPIST
jgi:integrase